MTWSASLTLSQLHMLLFLLPALRPRGWRARPVPALGTAAMLHPGNSYLIIGFTSKGIGSESSRPSPVPVFGPFPLTGNCSYAAAGTSWLQLMQQNTALQNYMLFLLALSHVAAQPRSQKIFSNIPLKTGRCFGSGTAHSRIASSDSVHRAAKQNCAPRFPKGDNGTSFLHIVLLCSWIQHNPKS